MADINLKYLTDTVQAALFQETTLANTVSIVKRAEGLINQSVNIVIDPLKDVTVKTYTKANKDANDDYDFDNIRLTTIAIVLDDEVYAAVQMDGWDTMVVDASNVSKFLPIINNLKNKIKAQLETALGAELNSLAGNNLTTVELVGTTEEEHGKEILAQIQKLNFAFNKNGVGAGRFLAVGENVATKLLANPSILHAANTGDETSQALRAAIIGSLAGFTVFVSDKIDTNSIVGYHPDGIALVSAAPGDNPTAAYSELSTLPQSPVDLRVNVIGMGRRNASGILASTFFNVGQLIETGATSNARLKKVTFTNVA